MTRNPRDVNAGTCRSQARLLPVRACSSTTGAPDPPVSRYQSWRLPRFANWPPADGACWPPVAAGPTDNNNAMTTASHVTSSPAARRSGRARARPSASRTPRPAPSSPITVATPRKIRRFHVGRQAAPRLAPQVHRARHRVHADQADAAQDERHHRQPEIDAAGQARCWRRRPNSSSCARSHDSRSPPTASTAPAHVAFSSGLVPRSIVCARQDRASRRARAGSRADRPCR